ncbi:MAG: hypothetical protein AAF902_22820, partial [Chloroflexota bacterium]
MANSLKSSGLQAPSDMVWDVTDELIWSKILFNLLAFGGETQFRQAEHILGYPSLPKCIPNYMKKIACISLVFMIQLLLAFYSPANSQPASFTLIDNFDSYLNGSINGQGNGDWVGNNPGATDGALVSDNPPAVFSGKTFLANPESVEFRGNAYRKLGNSGLLTNNSATYYFQLLLTDLSQTNISLGFSDDSSPNIFSSSTQNLFQAEINFQSDGARVRNGTSLEKIQNFTPQANQLIHIWFLIDHADDKYELYFATDANPVPAFSNNDSVYDLKDRQSAGTLTTFVVQSQGTTSGDVYLDELHADAGSSNLTF